MATLRLKFKPSEWSEEASLRRCWGPTPGRKAFQAEGRPNAEARQVLGNSQEATVSAAYWAKRRKEKEVKEVTISQTGTADKVSLSELSRAHDFHLCSASCTQREEATGHTSIV